jgi:hypothetical protein
VDILFVKSILRTLKAKLLQKAGRMPEEKKKHRIRVKTRIKPEKRSSQRRQRRDFIKHAYRVLKWIGLAILFAGVAWFILSQLTTGKKGPSKK